MEEKTKLHFIETIFTLVATLFKEWNLVVIQVVKTDSNSGFYQGMLGRDI